MASCFLSCCENGVRALTAMASEQKRPEMKMERQVGSIKLGRPAPLLAMPSRIAGTVLLTTPEVTPSPMTLASSFFSDQDPAPTCKSFSQSFTGDIASSVQQKAGTLGPSKRETEMAGFKGPEGVTGGPPVVRSSIARFKTMTPSRLPIPRSPFLTIPPGLSPTTLLDSPVLLSTGQAEPSPTTGTFQLPPLNYGNASITVPLSGVIKERGLDQDGSSFFNFKPFPSPGKNSLSLGPFGVSHQQTVAQVHTHAQVLSSLPQSTVPIISASPEPIAVIVSSGIDTPCVTAAKLVIPLVCKGPTEPVSQPCPLHVEKAAAPHSIVLSVHPLPTPDGSSAISVPPFPLPDKPSAGSAPPLSLPDRSSAFCVPSLSLPDRPSAAFVHPPPLADRPSEDGYNWRKYGQKQVKGSEYPRSYYKCTYPNCHVKKKVERSHDGQVTEIVYKGEHNHAKPQVTRRAKLSGNNISDGGSRQSIKLELKADKDGNSTIFLNTNAAAQGYRSDLKGERMPDLLSKVIVSSSGILTAGPSLESTSDDEGDGEISKTEDVDDDEPDSKRSKMERTTGTVLIAPFRTIREPRVVVQTTSEVDILDDGYRWRKYGQKVVKGNPHPRSYYKCTNLGCSVRKHVERSPTDAKAVITTYEGNHNHDIPAGRNNKYNYSGSAVMSSFPQVLPPAMSLVNSSATRPAPLLQDQYVLGKLLEERLKAHDTGSNFDSAAINSSLGSKQQKGSHECLKDSSKISGSSKGSVMNNIIPFDVSESSSQVTILRPKEEQVDGLIYDSSLPSGFSSCSSFCQVVQHRLIL